MDGLGRNSSLGVAGGRSSAEVEVGEISFIKLEKRIGVFGTGANE